MLIKNYGLFWKRKSIHWGKGNNPGHLKGRRSLMSDPVDFREQQGIYVLYDDGFKLVYVGQAGVGVNRLFDRLKSHRSDHLAERWSRFSWFGLRRVLGSGKLSKETVAAHPKLSDVLDHIEAILIAVTEPPHNRQGGRFGEAVEQYLQYFDDDNLYREDSELIKEMYDKIMTGA